MKDDIFKLEPFQPRAPWWGGDLQTMSSFILRKRESLAPYPASRVMLALEDGTGDRLAAMLNRPAAAVPGRPLVVLLHGLTGHQDSFYMQNTAARLLARGYPTLRLNVRGAGASRPFCRLQYHAGRSADLEMALRVLPADLAENGIVAIGFSLGANMLLKFLGERGTAAPLRAAVAVSAPLDLAGTSRRLMRRRNFLYQNYLLPDMRVEALTPAAELTAAERRTIENVRTIWEFDDRFSAPRNGFAGAEDYYERNSARNFLSGIARPTLVIHALDDPWIPPEPFIAFDWRSNPSLVPLISPRGGHVGFLGSDKQMPWYDQAIGKFLDWVISRP
jgi:uncharacterized protein